MNDFIQLEPKSNVFEAETMVEGKVIYWIFYHVETLVYCGWLLENLYPETFCLQTVGSMLLNIKFFFLLFICYLIFDSLHCLWHLEGCNSPITFSLASSFTFSVGSYLMLLHLRPHKGFVFFVHLRSPLQSSLFVIII